MFFLWHLARSLAPITRLSATSIIPISFAFASPTANKIGRIKNTHQEVIESNDKGNEKEYSEYNNDHIPNDLVRHFVKPASIASLYEKGCGGLNLPVLILND